MLMILCATLALTATPAPKAGHYYREAFAASVADKTFDPDGYVTHREASIRLTPPRATVDHGQTGASLELRSTKTGTITRWEAREGKEAWKAITLDVLASDKIRTDLAGELGVWVRLPEAFDALATKTRAERTKAQRLALVGRYKAADGTTITLAMNTGFKLTRCLESCNTNARAWCVTHKRVSYVLNDGALDEVGPPAGVCPDAPAFEKKEGARHFVRY